nr:MAG TPA: hypothetical protein [Caudoviricetes sp.]
MLFNLLRYRLNGLGYPAAMHSAVRRAVYPVKFDGLYSALVILIAACHGKHTLVNLFVKIFWYVCSHQLSLPLSSFKFNFSHSSHFITAINAVFFRKLIYKLSGIDFVPENISAADKLGGCVQIIDKPSEPALLPAVIDFKRCQYCRKELCSYVIFDFVIQPVYFIFYDCLKFFCGRGDWDFLFVVGLHF